jgi:hypothetical protein
MRTSESRRRLLRILWAALVTPSCGKGSEPTGPDIVPSAEREAHLNEMKGRLEDPPRLIPMTISEIAALPRFPHVYSRQQLAEISEIEKRGVVVEAYLARVRKRPDGDYHTQLTEAPPGRCLNEDTSDQLFTELTPGIRDRKPAYTFEALQSLCGSETRIRVSGWLMWDTPHHTRITFWEVHPVTRIECCGRELS